MNQPIWILLCWHFGSADLRETCHQANQTGTSRQVQADRSTLLPLPDPRGLHAVIGCIFNGWRKVSDAAHGEVRIRYLLVNTSSRGLYRIYC